LTKQRGGDQRFYVSLREAVSLLTGRGEVVDLHAVNSVRCDADTNDRGDGGDRRLPAARSVGGHDVTGLVPTSHRSCRTRTHGCCHSRTHDCSRTCTHGQSHRCPCIVGQPIVGFRLAQRKLAEMVVEVNRLGLLPPAAGVLALHCWWLPFSEPRPPVRLAG
jgi:hypothetical protein